MTSPLSTKLSPQSPSLFWMNNNPPWNLPDMLCVHLSLQEHWEAPGCAGIAAGHMVYKCLSGHPVSVLWGIDLEGGLMAPVATVHQFLSPAATCRLTAPPLTHICGFGLLLFQTRSRFVTQAGFELPLASEQLVLNSTLLCLASFYFFLLLLLSFILHIF